ncbi:MAG: TetR/AcrR family transcriptional regulator [Lachnospiraceae bacterium]|nr:TetR/AcrR family transcriptional regulator [Lachnospiraceae bacterium]
MFLEEGIAAFSMQQLAKNLDVSTVTLYKYFKNMDDIMQELGVQIVTNLTEKLYMQPPAHAESPTAVFLQQLRDFYGTMLKERRDLSLLLLFQIYTQNNSGKTPVDEHIRIYQEKWAERINALLSEMKSQGELSDNLSVDDAFVFISQTNTALVQYIGLSANTQDPELEKVIQRFIEQTIRVTVLYLKS